MELAIPRNKTA